MGTHNECRPDTENAVSQPPGDAGTTRSRNVTLLEGGTSAERAVSLVSGAACARALREGGYAVTEIDAADDDMVRQLLDSRPDVVFIALHGTDGEDGKVQGLCEVLRVPYTGSGVMASSLAMDKARSKALFRDAGLLTAPWVEISAGQEYSENEIEEKIGLPLVVKPSNEGSALGVSIVHDRADLAHAVHDALELDCSVVVERYLDGMEVTVAVLDKDGPMALPIIEIVPQDSSEFYDYEAKYAAGGATHIIPARLDDETTRRCEQMALAAHRVLGCQGVSRSDMIVDRQGSCWLLETNTIPGMTETSLLPHAAAHVGIDFENLCSLLVQSALARFEREHGPARNGA